MESLGRVSVSNASFSDTILTQKCSNDVVALFIKGKHLWHLRNMVNKLAITGEKSRELFFPLNRTLLGIVKFVSWCVSEPITN